MTKRPKVDAKLNQEEQPPKCCPTFTVTASTKLYGRLGLSDEDVVKRLEPTTPRTGDVRHPTVVAKLHEREVYLECGIVQVLFWHRVTLSNRDLVSLVTLDHTHLCGEIVILQRFL